MIFYFTGKSIQCEPAISNQPHSHTKPQRHQEEQNLFMG